MNGKKVGMSWKWLEGNCYFIDLEAEEDDNTARDGYYFYPNLSCGIHGKNKNSTYIAFNVEIIFWVYHFLI